MANTTTTEITSMISNFAEKVLLSRAYPHFVHALWAQVKDIPSKNSPTIKFRRYGNLTAATTALTEGVDPTGSQLSKSDISTNVYQYGDFVTITDWLELTAIENVKLETIEILGDQMYDTIDQLARNVLVAGTTIQYASTATSRETIDDGMIMNGDEVREAVRTLQGNNAKPVTEQIDPSDGFNTSPVAPAYIGIISHSTLYDLKKDPDWVPIEEYAQSDGRLGTFEKGKLDDVRFVLAGSNAKTQTGTLVTTVHVTVILGQECYGITRISGQTLEVITKSSQNNTTDTSNPLNLRSTMGWKISFACTRLNENFLLRIEHAVSA